MTSYIAGCMVCGIGNVSVAALLQQVVKHIHHGMPLLCFGMQSIETNSIMWQLNVVEP